MAADGQRLPALPPQDAIAYFQAKGYHLDPSFAWQDRWHEDHSAAFTVAKSAGFDILRDIYDAVSDAMRDGTTFNAFRDRLVPTLQAKGWWGRQEVTDPQTGETVSAQLGSVRRLRTIFDVNLRTAHAAGRWQQIQRHAAARPYLRYVAILDSKTRPLHREWHGTVLRIDHPWWRTHFPPNGWFCRCTVQTLSDHDLARYGFSVDPAPPDDGPSRRYVNPRTGAVVDVPVGIDPGWGYNPGQAAVDIHAARVAASKWVDAPPELTAAAQAASIRFMLPLLTRDMNGWVKAIADQVAAGTVRPIGEQRVVGALDPQTLDWLDRHGQSPASAALTITDDVVAHMLRTAKSGRGAAVDYRDIQRMPEILAAPEQVLFDTGDPALLYVWPAGPGVVGKFVARIDFVQKVQRQQVRTTAVRTAGLLHPDDLATKLRSGAPRYLEIPQPSSPQPSGGTPPSP